MTLSQIFGLILGLNLFIAPAQAADEVAPVVQTTPVLPQVLKVELSGARAVPGAIDLVTGSGTYIGNNMILTAGHVFDNGIGGSLGVGGYRARVLILDRLHDIAILQLLDKNGDPVTAEVADKDFAKSDLDCSYVPIPGDAVTVDGYPLTLPLQMIKTNVSGGIEKDKVIDSLLTLKNIFYIGSSIAPGTSGGPVYNDKTGKQIGVVSATVKGWPYSLIVPASDICKILGL